MGDFLTLLTENHLLLLFVVIGLGYLIGAVKVFGFNLGVAAVLFVGMAFGAVDPGLQLPEYIYIIGLVLFVYAIGLQAGPGFFASLRSRGLRFSLLAAAVVLVGALATVVVWAVTGISGPSAAGLFCGAMTNTPALAATVEALQNISHNLPSQADSLLITAPVVTYGLAYPFGVFGVIFWHFLFNRLFRIDFKHENTVQTGDSSSDPIYSVTYQITNPAVVEKTVERVLRSFGHTGFSLSRIRKGDTELIVTPDTILGKGDYIVAVGPERSHEIARLLFGEKADTQLPDRRDLSYRLVFVSNQEVIGKTIEDIQPSMPFPGAVTRLRRGDVEFIPSPRTILERGDRILVVSRIQDAEPLAEFFGDSIKAIAETDYLSLSLGIVLGVFVGMIPFPLPNGMTFKLGFAGGPLIVGLILGRLERTGPILWTMPFNANLVLRQIGLVFFLAAIGTRAGQGFSDIIGSGGWSLIAGGAVVTSIVTIMTIMIGYRYLKLPMSAVMGMMAGIQTQPATLAYANQQTTNELPNIWYATAYPASMISKIILAQIIVTLLLAF